VIKFRCPHCSQKIAVNDEGADVGIACPTCARPCYVPRESALEFSVPTTVLVPVSAVPAPELVVELAPVESVPAVADAPRAGSSRRARRLIERVVQALLFQRRRLLATQQTGTVQLAALEQRLSQLQAAYESRLHAYESRIGELEALLDRREEENRGLVRRQLELTVQALEAELTRTETEADASLRDLGAVLRA
jgi:hypothetical protein